ncbi:MAG: putative colanic acid biosynthesis UDP-glucose lipid carrier transferase [Polaribacter sp.]|jgi:putative colanic acid biosynthesis UDP-glucose lipid carrier transferase
MEKRYSHLIMPLQITLDVLILNLVIYFIFDKEYLNFSFISYISIYWLITSCFFGFYKVYRYTSFLTVFHLLAKQFLLFLLGYFAYFGIFKEGYIVNNQFLVLTSITLSISFVKFFWFITLKKYRSFGKNYRTVVVLGYDDSSKNIIKLFKSKSNLGYKYLGFFSNKEFKNKEYLGKLDASFEFSEQNTVDEIYCSLTTLTEQEIKKISKFALDRNIFLKLIPNSTELYSKNQSIEYYDDSLMILNIHKLPFEFSENFYIKRVFDIFFSLLVCLFILSWLIPLLWVLVKLESKGPLIFKQKREGINGEGFVCYKFRSMYKTKLLDQGHTKINDHRITKIGAFLRKTSMDEFPQFINVLLGQMSIVGPRPHMNIHSLKFDREVTNYIKRKSVKPGITGLAQVSGYRGEIQKKSDIENRVRLDIFYIENWSFFLDIKIIYQTLIIVFKGQKNAY